MTWTKTLLCLGLLAFCLTRPAAAQKNELALTLGGYFPVNSAVDAGNAFAIQGSYARRVASVPLISLYLELPVAGTFDSTVPLSSIQNAISPGNYSAIFFAPGLKLKLAPGFPVSPFFVAGGGFARFTKNAQLTASSGEQTTTVGVFDVGGGLDMKVAPWVSLRAEVRDFYSGSPRLTLSTLDQRQHNLVATAGLVLRF